jgi:hypothetical protein
MILASSWCASQTAATQMDDEDRTIGMECPMGLRPTDCTESRPTRLSME